MLIVIHQMLNDKCYATDAKCNLTDAKRNPTNANCNPTNTVMLSNCFNCQKVSLGIQYVCLLIPKLT